MALINIANHEIHCKIVYYGIGYCGKTTNLQYVYKSINPSVRGEMLSIATETERTLFFDFLPLDLGTVYGFRTRFHLYTVPGQILYERTRLAVLNGADGIVFVVDSQAEKFEENVQSISELEMNLRRLGKDLAKSTLPCAPSANASWRSCSSGIKRHGHLRPRLHFLSLAAKTHHLRLLRSA
ncbi:MAG: hypothetical protein NVS3B14_12530 [Ktedonobacteraceae bacterium]